MRVSHTLCTLSLSMQSLSAESDSMAATARARMVAQLDLLLVAALLSTGRAAVSLPFRTCTHTCQSQPSLSLALLSPCVSQARHGRSDICCCASNVKDEKGLSTFAGTSTVVKAVVGSLTAIVNVIFPPRSLTPEEQVALAARQAARQSAPQLELQTLMDGLREDFRRQYLFTGQIDPNLYDDDCVFTDPTLSFTGLATFERNLASLRPVLDAVLGETRVELYSLEASETCVTASWRMSGGIRLPWRPRIELRGRTRYTFDTSRKGRIVRYDEFWESSAAEQLLALFKPGAEFTKPSVESSGNTSC